MRKNDIVSLWLANVDDADKLKKFTDVSYTEDCDYIPSIFSDLFELEYYDEDFSDVGYVGNKDCVTELLNGFSYDYAIIPKFKKIVEKNNICAGDFNSVIVLYNFEYCNNQTPQIYDNCTFQFIASIKIESGLLCPI